MGRHFTGQGTQAEGLGTFTPGSFKYKEYSTSSFTVSAGSRSGKMYLATPYAVSPRGRATKNVLPWSFVLSTQMRPPWACTSSLVRYNPMPKPLIDDLPNVDAR